MFKAKDEICRNYHSIRHVLDNDNLRVLFTGASLSYNRYDFDPQARLNAYDCYPGMQSWSFLLRDRLIEKRYGYLFGDDIAAKYSTTYDTGMIRCGYKNAYVLPQYGKVLVFSGKTATDKLTVGYNTGDKDRIILYMLTNPSSDNGTFKIYLNGKYERTVNFSGVGKKYQGFEPFIVELKAESNKENIICFTDFTFATETSKFEIYLIGIAQEAAYINMSGQGSTTCKWLYDNMQERILDYQPDLLFITLMGNDRLRSDPDEFGDSLKGILHNVFAHRPNCEIVLILVPPSERDDEYINYNGWIYNESPETLRFHQKAKSIADDFNVMLINPYRLFSGIPVNRWRFDNIHMTQYGNELLANYLCELLQIY